MPIVGPILTRWQQYETEFAIAAAQSGFNAEYTRDCLEYARRLTENNAPIIFDLEHLSYLVGYHPRYLEGAAYTAERYYRTFTIPKRNGGERTIDEPLPSLKEIQRWILENVLNSQKPSRFAKGFVIGRSIRHNARFHRRQDVVLSMDIKDFFPSIKRKRVFVYFRSLGYTIAVADILARICTLRDVLPQGAPTSPSLSNLLTKRMDARLGGFALKQKLRYTRYADDITFSGKLDPGEIIEFTQKVCAAEGFELNTQKTRALRRHEQQLVTGIVVNERMHAPRKARRELRRAIHYIEQFGLNSHLSRIESTRAHYAEHLAGIANFILFINPTDRDALHAMEVLGPILESAETRMPESK